MSKRSGLLARVVVAAIGLPITLYCAWRGGWALGVLMAAIAALSAREFFALAPEAGSPARWLGTAASVSLVLLAAHDPGFAYWSVHAFAVLLFVGLATLGAEVFRPWSDRALLGAASAVLGVLYTGGTLAFAVLIRGLPEAEGFHPAVGFFLLLWPLLATWANDTAAYFGGRAFGRARLAPNVSPGKTVEGSIAGLLAASAVGLGLGVLAEPHGLVNLDALLGALVGLVLGVAAQLGDLVESRLKRDVGVKDSGQVLPGHGGMLDRFDALFFTLPAAYAVFAILGVVP